METKNRLQSGLGCGTCPACGCPRGERFYFLDRVPVCRACYEERMAEDWPKVWREHGGRAMRSDKFHADAAVVLSVFLAIAAWGLFLWWLA